MEIQTNQRKDEEKKKGGFWANLLGGTGSRAPGGLGSLGGGAGGWTGLLGRWGLGGGLLATKAGLIGLLMAGTTVAGGLGWLGYRIFGPSDADRIGASYSLFSPRPKEAASAQSGSGGDGSAQPGQSSLDQFKAANASAPGAADQAAVDKAASDKAAAEKAAADASAQAAAKKKGADNKGNVMGNQAAKLKSDLRVGQLSKMSGAPGGASSGASMSKDLASAKSLGALSSGVRSTSAGARASGARGVLGALQQAGVARSQNLGAPTSYGAGGQYDGSVPSAIGGAGTPAGGGGAGTPAGNTNPSAPTPTSSPLNQFPAPPTPTGNNVTPWQTALEMAVALVALASIILMFGKKIAKMIEPTGSTQTILYALAAIVAIIGVAVMALGHTIATGQFGQTYQGGMFVLAGSFLVVGGAAMMMNAADPKLMGGMGQTIMILSGAMGLGAAMVAYLHPMATYDQSTFPNGAPDVEYHAAPRNGAGQEYFVLGEGHGSGSRDS